MRDTCNMRKDCMCVTCVLHARQYIFLVLLPFSLFVSLFDAFFSLFGAFFALSRANASAGYVKCIRVSRM